MQRWRSFQEAASPLSGAGRSNVLSSPMQTARFDVNSRRQDPFERSLRSER